MTTRNYEAMFILDNNAATADFEATSGQVDAILQKHGGNIVVKEKWDDRKLAYEIKGRRRGTYYLTYFEAEPPAIEKIDEDVHLTENILRHIVIVIDEPIEQYIETRLNERELLAEDSRKNSLGGWGDRRRTRGAPEPRSRSETGDGGAPAAAVEAPAAATPEAATPEAATPVAATPVAATPVAATPVAATPTAAAEATKTDAPSNDDA